MDLQGLVLTGFRPEPVAKTLGHPKFELIRGKLQAHIGAGVQSSDLRKFSPKRHNQLNSSSCVANGITRGLEVKRIEKLYQDALVSGVSESMALSQAFSGHVSLSRLALYYLAREVMDPPETDQDNGTYVSCGAEALKSFGLCREEQDHGNPNDRAYWPFDLNQILVSPKWINMREAYIHKISAWYRINSVGDQRVQDVILALAAGNPVVYGAIVDDPWRSYDGTKPLDLMSGPSIGGHCTVLEGWDNDKQLFLGENSWGPDWGVVGPDGTGGFYEMTPEKIASTECSDFIVIQAGWEPWVNK